MEDTQNLAYAAIAVAAISLVVAVFAVMAARRARNEMRLFRGTADESDILTATAAQAARQDELTAKLVRLQNAMGLTQRDVAASLRHMSIVRFNAFNEMGGQFSFSAALLDDDANGIVFTGIQGQNQGRIYAKPIFGGNCEQHLTPEEKQAIATAKPLEEK